MKNDEFQSFILNIKTVSFWRFVEEKEIGDENRFKTVRNCFETVFLVSFLSS